MRQVKFAIGTAMVASALAIIAVDAHAESFFQIEAAVGGSMIKDMGDGTWIQQGAPNNQERKTTPAVRLGLIANVWGNGTEDVRVHADYTYIGTFRASVDGVPDQNYDPAKHEVVGWNGSTRYSPFSGQGHVQIAALTLDAGYTWHGYRFGIEAGPSVYWQTWHESLYDLADQWDDLSHKTVAQIGYVVGANIERGNFGVSYRYYGMSAKWNPYPGLATGAHVIMATYRF